MPGVLGLWDPPIAHYLHPSFTRFERGDVQIFQSHKYHCVEPVRRGKRVVLVIELWDGEERRCAHRCERRAGVCEDEARASASA